MLISLINQTYLVLGNDPDQNQELGSTRGSTRLPSPPRDVIGIVDGAKCRIQWSEPEDYGGAGLRMYRVYRGGSQYDKTLVKNQINPYRYMFFEDLTLEPATTYYYWVTAINDFGESNFSQPVILKTLGPKGPPGTVGLEVIDGKIQLSWIASNWTYKNGMTESFLERSSDSENYIIITTSTTDPLDLIEYVDLTILGGKTYWYRVSTRVSDSDIHSSIATKLDIPGIPSNVVELHSKFHGDKIKLIWDRPVNDGGSNLSGYKIKKGRSYESAVEVDVVRPEDTDWTDPDPWKDTPNYYVVVAYNSFGEGVVEHEYVDIAPDPYFMEVSFCLLSLFLCSMVPGLIAAGITWKVDNEKREKKKFDLMMERMRRANDEDGKGV
jgi:hypothetical protein